MGISKGMITKQLKYKIIDDSDIGLYNFIEGDTIEFMNNIVNQIESEDDFDCWVSRGVVNEIREEYVKKQDNIKKLIKKI